MVESLILIFAGSALLATLALYTRQPLIVAYIAIGMIVGPHALGWVADADLLQDFIPRIRKANKTGAKSIQNRCKKIAKQLDIAL